jgi:hypothetical protein
MNASMKAPAVRGEVFPAEHGLGQPWMKSSIVKHGKAELILLLSRIEYPLGTPAR